MGVNKHHLVQPLQWINMNWHDVNQFEDLKYRIKKLGYVMRRSKYGNSGEHKIGVFALEDHLPIYSRDAQLFSGDTEMIMSWVLGVEHRNEYILMMKATTEKKVKALEEKYIKNRLQTAMLHKIKNPDKPIDKHTQDLIDLQNK